VALKLERHVKQVPAGKKVFELTHKSPLWNVHFVSTRSLIPIRVKKSVRNARPNLRSMTEGNVYLPIQTTWDCRLMGPSAGCVDWFKELRGIAAGLAGWNSVYPLGRAGFATEWKTEWKPGRIFGFLPIFTSKFTQILTQ
jgi:hypothetical protein